MDKTRTIVHPKNGDKVTFQKIASETGGELTELQLEVFPYAQGTSNDPLHYHNSYSETFKVSEGRLTVVINHDKRILEKGESATVAIKEYHHFCNEHPEIVQATIELRPGSIGFEKGLCILYGLAGDGKLREDGMPKSLTHAALLMVMGDIRMGGIFKIIFPMLKIIAHFARKRGVEKELIEKYCNPVFNS